MGNILNKQAHGLPWDLPDVIATILMRKKLENSPNDNRLAIDKADHYLNKYWSYNDQSLRLLVEQIICYCLSS
jgi:hypothetical protein